MRLRTLPTVAFAAALLGVNTGAATSPSPSPPEPACVALTLPSVSGIDGTATTYAIAVRDLFASFLTGPSIKTILLDARLPSQAALEARDKGCGRVLLATVTRKRSGGSGVGSVLGKAAGMAAIRAPLGSGVTGAITSSATSAAGEVMYGLASQTRAKDEIELTYRLAAPDAIDAAKPVTSKAKAKSDGEDLLTPLIENAANGIVAAVAGGPKG